MELQRLLDKWNIKCDIGTILGMWNESHRSYHGLDHLNDLISLIEERKQEYTEKECEKMMLAALFHDAVYDPASKTNEEDSARFLMECAQEKSDDIKHVRDMILETKSHAATTPLSESFCGLDMNIVERGIEDLIEWERGISEEYSIYPKEEYKEGRIKFLESLLDKHPLNSDNLLRLIDIVKSN